MAIVASLLVGAAAAAAQWWLLLELGIDPRTAPPLAWGLVAMPVAAALLAALVGLARRGASTERAAEPAPAAEPPEHAALRLLGLLQEEGRLIDFLTEDVGPYSDEQVGAATRGIHGDCMKALRSCLTLERVLDGQEDAEVTVEAGFDPAAIRLTGNVAGAPPFKGVLRHAGWRAARIEVPARSGVDPAILAPAEVEIP